MAASPLRWSRLTLVVGAAAGIAVVAVAARWLWRRRQAAAREGRYESGIVELRGGQLLNTEDSRDRDQTAVKFLFASELYTETYGVVVKTTSRADDLLRCGLVREAAIELANIYLKYIDDARPLQMDDDTLTVLEANLMLVYSRASHTLARRMFDKTLAERNKKDPNYMQGRGRDITYAYAYGTADLEALKPFTDASIRNEALASLGTNGGFSLSVVYALVAHNMWDEAISLIEGLMLAVPTLGLSPEVGNPVIVSLLLNLAHTFQWSGNTEKAVRLLMAAVQQSDRSGMNASILELALTQCSAELGYTQMDKTLSVFDGIFNRDNMYTPIPANPRAPASAPKRVPPIVPLVVFSLGMCTQAICLYGPRDPQSGALLTPRAEFAEARVTLQFASKSPVTPSPFVYVVGHLYLANDFNAPPVEMRWRAATADMIHTAVSFTSPPIPRAQAGNHRLKLVFYSSPDATAETQLGLIHQWVWCPMAVADVTERESRALWRYSRECDPWQNPVDSFVQRRNMELTAALLAAQQEARAAGTRAPDRLHELE